MAIHKRVVDCRVGLKVLLAMTLTITEAGEACLGARHGADVEKLERHDWANGVAVGGAVVLIVAVHTERTTRTGVEEPRVGTGVLRRRPNELLSTGYISYDCASGNGNTGVDSAEIDGIIKVV